MDYIITVTTRVGTNIKKWREARGMTQVELAEKVGIHRVFLALMETHRKTPSLDMLEKLAKALKVEVKELVE